MLQVTGTPTRFTPFRSSLKDAHAHLVDRIGDNTPYILNSRLIADAEDFNERADHVRSILIAVTDYVRVAVKDISDKSNTAIDERYLLGLLNDVTGDVVGALNNAAEDLREAA